MHGKIYKIVKILGRMNSRTVMIPRRRVLMALLSTEDSNDSQKRMRAVLTIIRSFHSSNPCFSVTCPKGVGYARVYCTPIAFKCTAMTRLPF